MKEYKAVRSTEQPEAVAMDEFSVWVTSNVKPVTEEATEEGGTGFTGFEFDQEQYTKDEYILKLNQKCADMETEMTSTQVALCDVYELLG